MRAASYCFISIFLAVCCVGDLRNKRIARGVLVIGGLVAAGLAGLGLALGQTEFLTVVSGLAVGAGAVLVSKVTGEKLGLGDALALLVCSPLIGAFESLFALLCAFAAAAVVSAGFLLFKRCGLKYELPFIPFMFAGMMITMVTG